MKTLETTKQRELATKKLSIQIGSLRGICAMDPEDHAISKEGISLLDELIAELEERRQFLLTSKQWLFNFTGGGWNSIYALDKEEAIKLAGTRYHDCNPKSFRLSTDEEEQGLLSSFY